MQWFYKLKVYNEKKGSFFLLFMEIAMCVCVRRYASTREIKQSRKTTATTKTEKKSKIKSKRIGLIICIEIRACAISSDSIFRMLMSYFLFAFLLLFFLYVCDWLTGWLAGFFYHCLNWHCVIVFFISIDEIIFNSNFEGPTVCVCDGDSKRTNGSRANVSFICVRSLLFFNQRAFHTHTHKHTITVNIV